MTNLEAVLALAEKLGVDTSSFSGSSTDRLHCGEL